MSASFPTAEKKLACVVEQLALVEAGQQNFIGCPYCGQTVEQGKEFCCDMLTKAVKAVLDAELMARNLEICERINKLSVN